jgi:hypothetical protein
MSDQLQHTSESYLWDEVYPCLISTVVVGFRLSNLCAKQQHAVHRSAINFNTFSKKWKDTI